MICKSIPSPPNTLPNSKPKRTPNLLRAPTTYLKGGKRIVNKKKLKENKKSIKLEMQELLVLVIHP
jgi:hypothetical protein